MHVCMCVRARLGEAQPGTESCAYTMAYAYVCMHVCMGVRCAYRIAHAYACMHVRAHLGEAKLGTESCACVRVQKPFYAVQALVRFA